MNRTKYILYQQWGLKLWLQGLQKKPWPSFYRAVHFATPVVYVMDGAHHTLYLTLGSKLAYSSRSQTEQVRLAYLYSTVFYHPWQSSKSTERPVGSALVGARCPCQFMLIYSFDNSIFCRQLCASLEPPTPRLMFAANNSLYLLKS